MNNCLSFVFLVQEYSRVRQTLAIKTPIARTLVTPNINVNAKNHSTLETEKHAEVSVNSSSVQHIYVIKSILLRIFPAGSL